MGLELRAVLSGVLIYIGLSVTVLLPISNTPASPYPELFISRFCLLQDQLYVWNRSQQTKEERPIYTTHRIRRFSADGWSFCSSTPEC